VSGGEKACHFGEELDCWLANWRAGHMVKLSVGLCKGFDGFNYHAPVIAVMVVLYIGAASKQWVTGESQATQQDGSWVKTLEEDRPCKVGNTISRRTDSHEGKSLKSGSGFA
jgi:mitochondrial fission protein ELM1